MQMREVVKLTKFSLSVSVVFPIKLCLNIEALVAKIFLEISEISLTIPEIDFSD